MASRLIDEGRAKVTAETFLYLHSPFLGSVPGNSNVGKLCKRFEYKAMLNGGETISCSLEDSFFTMLNDAVSGFGDGDGESSSDYFQDSRTNGPMPVSFKLSWLGDTKLVTPEVTHALVGFHPVNNGESSTVIRLIAIDHASWFLSGGDAGGHSYEGNVELVIKQVIEKYGRGILEVDFKSKTSDSVKNRWWQYRLDPKSFIMSMLEWTSPFTVGKTKWIVYPDDENGKHRITITDQSNVQSLHRANYHWKGYGNKDLGVGDIIEWEAIGDNALQMIQHKVVASGISAVSGIYYDRSNINAVVDDDRTPNKLRPSMRHNGSYTRPNPDLDPLDKSVGFTAIPAIPEMSAGDVGMNYDQYVDGTARNLYMSLNESLFRIRLRVTGHYIWVGSEGLGVDTIGIMINTAGGQPYFLKGNWVVYGYHHVLTTSNWYTDLYCYRLDWNATAREVGASSSVGRYQNQSVSELF